MMLWSVPLRRGSLAALGAVLAMGSSASPSRAEGDLKAQCVEAHLASQKLSRLGQLGASRKQLLECVDEGCPGPIRDECSRWLEALDGQMPSVVFAARDERGADTSDVRVWLDGTGVLERLDGRPMQLDPGPHRVVCTHEGRTLKHAIVVSQGVQNREVTCDFSALEKTPAAPAPAAPQSGPSPPTSGGAERGQPVAAYVLGGVGIVGLVTFVALGISGSNDADELHARCGSDAPAPATDTCDEESDIQPVRTKLLAADIALGIGAGFLALGTGLFIYHHVAEADEPATASTFSIGVSPTIAGATGLLRGTF